MKRTPVWKLTIVILLVIISITALSCGHEADVTTSTTNNKETTGTVTDDISSIEIPAITVEYTGEEREQAAELTALVPEYIQKEFELKYGDCAAIWDSADHETLQSNTETWLDSEARAEYKELEAYCEKYEGYILPLLLQKYLEDDDYFFQEQCLNAITLSRYDVLLKQAQIDIYSQTASLTPNNEANIIWKSYIKALIEVTYTFTFSKKFELALSWIPTTNYFENYGPLYRANLLAVGKENTAAIIESGEEGLDGFIISCRRTIETSPDKYGGDYAENIFYVHTININPSKTGNPPMAIEISAAGLPEGVAFSQSETWHGKGAPFQCKRLTGLEISDDTQPGEYPFEYLININGVYIGTLSCTLIIN